MTQKKCINKKCKRIKDVGITLISGEEEHFSLLKKDEWAHIECYIEHCIKHYNNILNKKTG